MNGPPWDRILALLVTAGDLYGYGTRPRNVDARVVLGVSEQLLDWMHEGDLLIRWTAIVAASAGFRYGESYVADWRAIIATADVYEQWLLGDAEQVLRRPPSPGR